MQTPLKAPFPYFGGKANAAPLVWDALGDVGGYVEPFAGSAAVLLRRPTFSGRRVETINDADGWLVNAWRAIQLSPDEVARHAYNPVTEIDFHARLAWLNERRDDDLVSWLEGDPEAHDSKAAGWWLYVMACGIGDPFQPGPWCVIDGRLVKAAPDRTGVIRQIPHLGDAGQGIRRQIPHLGNAGQGVRRQIPHLGDAGRGVNRTHDGDAGQGALAAYIGALSSRLNSVRITAGDWRRVLKPSATRATAGPSSIGLFLDPPYSTSGDLYASTSTGEEHKTISAEVREWCLNAPDHFRIVLSGYDDEHAELEDHGWAVRKGKAGGGAGYSTNSDNGQRERLWVSPSCRDEQPTLLEGF